MKKQSKMKKFLFEFSKQLREFFSNEIPYSWEEAKYQMQIENIICSKDLYLEALIEQQDDNK